MASHMLGMLSSNTGLYPQPVYALVTEAKFCTKTQAILTVSKSEILKVCALHFPVGHEERHKLLSQPFC